ncbi:MAG: exodeoxyribonuclease VII large subunit [Acidimicrobiales bacterium]
MSSSDSQSVFESTSLGDPPDNAQPASPTSDTLTVTELCARVEDRVAEAFPDEVWIQGAISGLSRSANGHVYFDLIDPSDEMGSASNAVLPVALFASSRNLVNKILRKAGGIRMHDGIEIRIRGRVGYYAPQGRVQLVMSLIDPQFTLGQMVEARAALLEKLSGKGLLDRNQQVPFPVLPLRVALITSGASAAFADFIHEIEISGYPFRITLLDSRVQGLEAVPSLRAAVEATDELDVDVVVMIRGGGARTDLVAFDHEQVAVAVAHCRHPVIVGVGHETDRSVADEVAHTTAKTPTATAALLVDAVGSSVYRTEIAAARLGSLTELHLTAARERLIGAGARLTTAAGRVVDGQRTELRHAAHRLSREPGRQAERADHRLTTIAARLAALDPATALRRGWTITYTEAGELVRSVDQVATGTRLRTSTIDGTIASEVVDSE